MTETSNRGIKLEVWEIAVKVLFYFNFNISAIASMDFHENWNTPDFDHDICMITLKEPLNLDDPNVQPIEFFQTSDAEIPAETVCNSTGWGLTNGNGKDREMNTVDLKKTQGFKNPL